jgi:hypothetical protein
MSDSFHTSLRKETCKMLQKFSFFKSDFKQFKFWFGFGSPVFLLMTLTISYLSSPMDVFYGYIIISQLWWWESLYTTCRRCPNYGTTNCGIQGLMVKHLVPFSSKKLSRYRISQHKFFDLFYMGISVLICWNFLITGIIASIWVIGVLKISFYPNKFHGLQFQLK